MAALLAQGPVVSLPSLAPPTDKRRRSTSGAWCATFQRAAVRRLVEEVMIGVAGAMNAVLIPR
ncbi:hypothetical protein [Streptomyces sp. CA-179760]|uniref:hypothetical protein n=1 Tax=Streptomyces sp. CA-179760 TaxID=3240054 RepID=UPI003D908743